MSMQSCFLKGETMTQKQKLICRIIVYLMIIGIALFVIYQKTGHYYVQRYKNFKNKKTVAEVIEQIRIPAYKRLMPAFETADLAYPPNEIAFLVFKEERSLELWARTSEKWKQIKTYKIFGASGIAGPKFKEGDMQVPEGIYKIIGLNPNSSFHLSMKVDYPNSYDRARAREAKRTNLGGDIFIHGSSGSVGCVAIGDIAIEELFLLARDVGKNNVTVISSPRDLRVLPEPENVRYEPAWLHSLYQKIKTELKPFTQKDRS